MVARSLLELAMLSCVCAIVLFVPGFALVRRLRVPPVLMLALSVTVSSALLYPVAFLLYLTRADAVFFWAITALSTLLGIRLRREIVRLFSEPQTRTALLGCAAFVAWAFALMGTVRHYSGGGWITDWAEHYQRTLFFLESRSPQAVLPGDLWLTERPPLFNLLAGFLLMHVGRGFYVYQWAATLLNGLVFLGALAALHLLRHYEQRPVPNLAPLLALMAFNPSVMQNATYLWTRSLTAFFVLLALVLWWRATFEEKRREHGLAYLALGLAMTTHYSAAPYLLAIVLADGVRLARRRLALGRSVLAGAALCAPLLPWLAFAVHRHGVFETFGHNATFHDTVRFSVVQNVLKVLYNIIATIVPHPFRTLPDVIYQQRYVLGWLRDYTFLLYQTNLLLMLGSVGWIAVMVRLIRSAVRNRTARNGAADRSLLVTAFVVFTVVVGIAVYGGRDYYGIAHICLQPLSILGLAYAASFWNELRPWARRLWGGGLAIDLVIGIGLHFRVQALKLAAVKSLKRDGITVGSGILQGLKDKAQGSYVFSRDIWPLWVAAALAALALLLFVKLVANGSRSDKRP